MKNKNENKLQNTVAGFVKNLAERAAKDAAGKKLVYVFYEPQMPEAVKKLADRK